MHVNEIRDFIERAPKRFAFDGQRMRNHAHVRYQWFSQISIGSIDSRINRRAGIVDKWIPWVNPTYKSMSRHRKKVAKRSQFIRGLGASPF